MSAALVGPPLLLVYEGNAWIDYSLLTLVIAVLAGTVLLGKTPEAQVISGFFAVVVWLGAGFFAAALSV